MVSTGEAAALVGDSGPLLVGLGDAPSLITHCMPVRGCTAQDIIWMMSCRGPMRVDSSSSSEG